MAAHGRPRPLARLAWALGWTLGLALAFAPRVASASSSSSVEYCSAEDVEKIASNPLIVQCSAATGYNFSSGVQPTDEQAQEICESSCLTVFQTASLSSDDCVIPNGDHISFLSDLVNYVLTICLAGPSSASDSAGSAALASDSSSSSSSAGSSVSPIVIGVAAAAVVLLALLGGLFWRKRRQRPKQSAEGDQFDSEGGYVPVLSNVNENGHRNVNSWQSSHTGTTATTASSASSGFSSSISRKKRPRLADLSPWRVDVESIQDIDRLGHGAFGVVWRVMYRGSTILASKRIQTDQVSQKRTQDFIDEITLISSLQHPNIVEFVGVAWTMESDLQVLLEFMNEGDLRGYLLRPETPRVWTLQKLSIAHDIVQALVYVHSFQPPLLHRDLKSHNIMLTTNGFQDGDPRATMVVQTALTAKLTDFGVSRFHSENNTMTIGVGTSRWLAPEVIVGETNYGPEADVYSFGVVLSELDTHALPYDDEQTEDGESLANVAILQRVALGELKPAFNTKTCIPELLALAQRCLQHDASKRPSAPMVAYELRTMMKAMLDPAAEEVKVDPSE